MIKNIKKIKNKIYNKKNNLMKFQIELGNLWLVMIIIKYYLIIMINHHYNEFICKII